MTSPKIFSKTLFRDTWLSINTNSYHIRVRQHKNLSQSSNRWIYRTSVHSTYDKQDTFFVKYSFITWKVTQKSSIIIKSFLSKASSIFLLEKFLSIWVFNLFSLRILTNLSIKTNSTVSITIISILQI